jgi:hypothetical protein
LRPTNIGANDRRRLPEPQGLAAVTKKSFGFIPVFGPTKQSGVDSKRICFRELSGDGAARILLEMSGKAINNSVEAMVDIRSLDPGRTVFVPAQTAFTFIEF